MVGDRVRLIKETAAGRYAILKEQALQARQRGVENDVNGMPNSPKPYGR